MQDRVKLSASKFFLVKARSHVLEKDANFQTRISRSRKLRDSSFKLSLERDDVCFVRFNRRWIDFHCFPRAGTLSRSIALRLEDNLYKKMR